MGVILRLIAPLVNKLNRHVGDASLHGSTIREVWNEVPSGDFGQKWFLLDHVPRNNSQRGHLRGLRLTPTTDYTMHGRWIEMGRAITAGSVGWVWDYEWDESIGEEQLDVTTMLPPRRGRKQEQVETHRKSRRVGPPVV